MARQSASETPATTGGSECIYTRMMMNRDAKNIVLPKAVDTELLRRQWWNDYIVAAQQYIEAHHAEVHSAEEEYPEYHYQEIVPLVYIRRLREFTWE